MLDTFWERRNLFFAITAGCLVLGILYALLTPVEFKSKVLVMPETGSKQSEFSNLIKNYGGLLGLNSGSSFDMSKNKPISPQVYPRIVNSLSFQHLMLRDTVYFADTGTSATLFQYFNDRVGTFYSGWFGSSKHKQISNKLPARLRQQLDAQQISSVSRRELEVIKTLRERIKIQFDTQTGVMKVTAEMPDAVAAAQVCNHAIKLLTDYLKEYRTQKAKNVLQFSNKQYKIARQKFRNAQSALAKFKDKNLNLSTAKAQSQEKYLQSKYDLAYTVYNSVAQNRIQARMNLQENTPVFKTLQPANIPLERDKPLWIPIIIFAIAAGVVLSFLVIGGLYAYRNLKVKP